MSLTNEVGALEDTTKNAPPHEAPRVGVSISHISLESYAQYTHYSRTIDALFTHNKRTINGQ